MRIYNYGKEIGFSYMVDKLTRSTHGGGGRGEGQT